METLVVFLGPNLVSKFHTMTKTIIDFDDFRRIIIFSNRKIKVSTRQLKCNEKREMIFLVFIFREKKGGGENNDKCEIITKRAF